jgi:tripartite-type tricarboxylate transporter receptor subunit TctC
LLFLAEFRAGRGAIIDVSDGSINVSASTGSDHRSFPTQGLNRTFTVTERAFKESGRGAATLAVLAAVALGLAGLVGERRGTGPGESPAPFRVATITWIVPYRPGGGFDAYSRIAAPYLAEHAGARVRIRNLPGAGGLKALKELLRSPADGRTIALINGGALVTGSLDGTASVLGQLSVLARMSADRRVLTVGAESGLDSSTDILAAGFPLRIGATGFGASTYLDSTIFKQATGMDVEIIHGFENSSEVRHAILRGDLHGAWTSWGSARGSLATGQVRAVLQSGRDRAGFLTGVPTVFEFMQQRPEPGRALDLLEAWEVINAVGRVIAAPPGLDGAKLAFLRDALGRALNDPGFLAEMERAGRSVEYADGAATEELARNALSLPEETRRIIIEAMRSELR